MRKKAVLFIAFSLLFSGCWDKAEIENKNIVSLIGYDLKEDNSTENRLELILVTPKIDNDGSDIIISTEGKTFNDSLDNISRKSSKEVSLGQVKIFLMRKELFNDKNIISELSDSLLRNPNINRNTYMVAIDGDVDDLVSKEKGEDIKNYILGLLKNYTSNSEKTIFDINAFLIGYYEKSNMIIPTLKKNGDEIIIDYFIVFDNTGIKRSISMEEFKICQILKGKNIPILVTIPDKKVDIALTNNLRRINLKDNNMEIALNLKGELKQKQDENFNEENIKEDLNEHLNKSILDVLDICIKENIDLLGLKDYMYKFHQNIFQTLNLNDSLYEKLNIRTKTDIKINSKGESK